MGKNTVLRFSRKQVRTTPYAEEDHVIHKIDSSDTSITPSMSCKERCSGRCSTSRLDSVEPASTKTPISRPWPMARLSITPSWWVIPPVIH